MDERNEAINQVRQCIKFVLKKKVLEPDITSLSLIEICRVFSDNNVDEEAAINNMLEQIDSDR